MYLIKDANGEQLKVEDIKASLAQVEVFLSDGEIAGVMTAEETAYYKDLKQKLLQLQ